MAQAISKMETTAVDWLVKELNLEGYDATVSEAKAMEKEQIINGFDAGERECQSIWYETGQQYYKEKYGTKEL